MQKTHGSAEGGGQVWHLLSVVDVALGSGDGGHASECSAAATALSTPSGVASESVNNGASRSPAYDSRCQFLACLIWMTHT